jgi:DNA-binding PadR family transcriptional regulator
MARGEHLGEFEQVVLLAVVRLGDSAYGMKVRREIEERAGRRVSIGAIYATVDRLVIKGYLRAHDGSASAERSGLARRFFAITRRGIDALETARDVHARMWAGVHLQRLRGKA